MKKPVVVFIILVLLIGALGLGYIIGSSRNEGLDSGGSGTVSISAPVWEKGMFWVYSFNTPDTGFLTSLIGVAGDDGENYQVGVDNRMDARRHAVLNFNPMLGRIGMNGLEVYEKGEPQPLFQFPLNVSARWSFSMFNIEDFEAVVLTIQDIEVPGENATSLVNIEAKSSSGEKLHYTYDSSAMWLSSLVLERNGERLLEMNLVTYGIGYSGELYFVRGVDLFDEGYSAKRGSPVMDVYDTFIDQGHPNWGPFDNLIYFLEVETGDATYGTLTIRDHLSTNQLRKTFQANTVECSLGIIPSEAGEWGITVSMFGTGNLRLRIAGGLEYSWTV